MENNVRRIRGKLLDRMELIETLPIGTDEIAKKIKM